MNREVESSPSHRISLIQAEPKSVAICFETLTISNGTESNPSQSTTYCLIIQFDCQVQWFLPRGASLTRGGSPDALYNMESFWTSVTTKLI